jgi:hypothetical protein
MRRVCLLLASLAGLCLAQTESRGFVNPRLLRADLMKQRQVTAPAPAAVQPEKRCMTIDPIERIPTSENVDRGILLSFPQMLVDAKMIIPVPPPCRQK